MSYGSKAIVRSCYGTHDDFFKIIQYDKREGVIYESVIYITRIFPIMPRRSEIVYRHIIIS